MVLTVITLHRTLQTHPPWVWWLSLRSGTHALFTAIRILFQVMEHSIHQTEF